MIPLLFSASHYLVQSWGFPKNAWQCHGCWETAYDKVKNTHIKHDDSVFGEGYQFKWQGQQGTQTVGGKTIPVRTYIKRPIRLLNFIRYHTHLWYWVRSQRTAIWKNSKGVSNIKHTTKLVCHPTHSGVISNNNNNQAFYSQASWGRLLWSN
jgi:hypothetical protein